MRIAFVSHYDARDIRSWSGTGYHIPLALAEQGIEVAYVGPLRHQLDPINIARYLFNQFILGRTDHPHRDPGFLRSYGRQVNHALAGLDVDVVFAPGSIVLSYIETDLPVVMWSDCTFASLQDYYSKFSNLSRRTIRNGHDAEQRALDRCDLIIMSSQWAIDSAVNDYGVDPARTALVSFGANIAVGWTRQDVEAFIAGRPRDACRLLLIGVDWQRKGGPAAVAVAEELKRRGVSVELTVVGCEPKLEDSTRQLVNAAGFVAKNQPEGAARLAELLRRSHFLILPTRADCTPIVFAEAASLGLPSLTTRTGGVPSVIEDGVNGLLFDLDAPASACADVVQRLLSDSEAYARLARSTFAEYERRLNWAVAGRRVRALLEGLLARQKPGGA